MNRLDEPVFTETSKEKIVAVLYQAMFDETIRLRKCRSKGERKDIRDFLTSACRICMQPNPRNEDPEIFRENMLQLRQETSK